MATLATYTVKSGDTLSKLAPILLGPGKTYHELMTYNPQITNPNLIQIGQKIYYPETYGPQPLTTTPISWASSSDIPSYGPQTIPAVQASVGGEGLTDWLKKNWIVSASVAVVGAALLLIPKGKKK